MSVCVGVCFCSTDTPRIQVVLPTHQFSSSHSPATLRTKVVLPSRQFSSSSSPATPRTKVVLQSRQFSASSSTDCSAYSSCTRNTSPVLSFQLPNYSAYYSCTTKSPVLIFQLPRHSAYSSCKSPVLSFQLHSLLRSNRTLACVWRTRHARSPQRVAR